MTDDIGNPHDLFFQQLMALPNAAADIARQTLPPEVLTQLDLTFVEKVEDSWVDEELRSHFADALYRVTLLDDRDEAAYLLILFEHKSSPDKWVAFQVLRYMVQMWQNHRKNDSSPLPIIIPLVLYHGRDTWHVPMGFDGLFEHVTPGTRRYLPHFEYALLDISAGSAGDISAVTDPVVRAYLRLFWLIFRADLRGKLPDLLRSLPTDKPGMLELVESICRYVMSGGKVTEPELAMSMQQAFPGAPDVTIQFFEDWKRRYRNEGREEGREEGLQAGIVQVFRRKFKDQVADKELRDRLRGLSASQLEELTGSLLDFEKAEEFYHWLEAQPRCK